MVFRPLGQLLGAIYRFPPVKYNVHTTRIVPIKMTDGSTLIGTLFSPCHQRSHTIEQYQNYPQGMLIDKLTPQPHPTVLIQTPYNRNIFESAGNLFGERGYYVLVIDVRGRCASEGEDIPFKMEGKDAIEVIKWLHLQPWFQKWPKLGTWGPSYMGIVQYQTLAMCQGESYIQAMMPMMCTSSLYPFINPDGGMLLSMVARWFAVTKMINSKTTMTALIKLTSKMDEITDPYMDMALPDIDKAINGPNGSAFVQGALENHDNPEAAYWSDRNWSSCLANCPPIHIVGGWLDIFLRDTIRDYRAAVTMNSEENVKLTIGPWTHFSHTGLMNGASKAMWYFDEVLKGAKDPRNEKHHREKKKPVALYIMNAKEWKYFDEYPPPSISTPLYLSGDMTLNLTANESETQEYVFDPADPTPHHGGPEFHPFRAGIQSQAKIETRNDILVYTSPVLENDLEIIGPISLELSVTSSLRHTDFIGRLCVVLPNKSSKSLNICEGSIRLTPSSWSKTDSPTLINIDMWATAYRFIKGSRIRVHVCSGAYPRLLPNYGTGTILKTEPKLSANQAVFHSQAHPSRLLLPITEGILNFHD